jgi:hypothetical protein
LDLSRAVNAYVLDQLLVEDLPSIAVRAIENGYDSSALRQLAAAKGYDADSLRALFLKALWEMEMSLPSATAAGLSMARSIANEILKGSLPPYQGAKRIWKDIYTRLPELAELRPFVGLASEYEDDEKHQNDYSQLIVDACRELLRR